MGDLSFTYAGVTLNSLLVPLGIRADVLSVDGEGLIGQTVTTSNREGADGSRLVGVELAERVITVTFRLMTGGDMDHASLAALERAERVINGALMQLGKEPSKLKFSHQEGYFLAVPGQVRTTRKVAHYLTGDITFVCPSPFLYGERITTPGLVTYEWAGTRHESESIKKVDGVEVARNRAVNPSFEVSTAGVTTAGPVSLALPTWTPAVAYGGHSLHVELTADATGITYVSQTVGVTPGKYLGVKVPVRWGSGSRYARLYFTFRSADNTTVSTVFMFPTLLSNNYSEPLEASVLVPATAHHVLIRLQLLGADSTTAHPVAGTSVHTDGWHVAVADTEQDALAQVAQYFDGDKAGGIQTGLNYYVEPQAVWTLAASSGAPSIIVDDQTLTVDTPVNAGQQISIDSTRKEVRVDGVLQVEHVKGQFPRLWDGSTVNTTPGGDVNLEYTQRWV